LRLQLQSLVERVNRCQGDIDETTHELRQIELTLKRLVDFTLPDTEKADGE
jgi:hypothetical protein